MGITAAIPDAILAYRIDILVSGLWWLIFACFTFAWLKSRPGPPLPKGESYALLPWKQLGTNLSRAAALPHTFGMLLCWFGYSDGFNVISSVRGAAGDTARGRYLTRTIPFLLRQVSEHNALPPPPPGTLAGWRAVRKHLGDLELQQEPGARSAAGDRPHLCRHR